MSEPSLIPGVSASPRGMATYGWPASPPTGSPPDSRSELDDMSSPARALRERGLTYPSVGVKKMPAPVSYRTAAAQSPEPVPHKLGGRSRSDSVDESKSKQKEGDTSHFVLDIQKVSDGRERRTTLMIKNIPNKYSQKMLLAAVDEHHRGKYDFFYLPIDFKNKCNVGYAFINFIDCLSIIPFYNEFHGKKWEKFNSEKVCAITYARIQGKNSLIAHFQNSSLMCEDRKCRPIIFHSEGPHQGEQEPFPVGNNIRMRRKENERGKPISENKG